MSCRSGWNWANIAPPSATPRCAPRLGLADDEPLIIYAGRLDREKRPDVVAEAFLQLPPEMRAFLVLIGDGPMRGPLTERLAGKRALLPGYVQDRTLLAQWLASADLYASAMADETFGISVIEAQASGLPVVGVAGGAMVDRVTPAIGRIGPVLDAAAMARNLAEVWAGDTRAMGEASWRHAQQFSWRESMHDLFGELYPRALKAAAQRAARRAGGARAADRGAGRGARLTRRRGTNKRAS